MGERCGYGRAEIRGLYRGIDAVFYLDGGRPRYDLVVGAGADPSQVRMSINRGEALSVTPSGALSIATSVGRIEQRELYAYQEIAGVRHQVKCSFVVDGSGNVYINGSTSSTDFPTTSGAFQTSLVGNVDVTVTKLNSNGTLGARMKDEG